MGPLPNTWWMHRIIDAMTWSFATWETIHFDLKNRGILLFWKPPLRTIWDNYWVRQLPESYILYNYKNRRYHMGWFVWHICEKVEKLWKRL